MGARQSTSVSKKERGPSSLNRSAPISRTRNGALSVVSTSRATNCASSSFVRGPTSGASTAISSHGTGCAAPRGLSRTGLWVTWLSQCSPCKRDLIGGEPPHREGRPPGGRRGEQDRHDGARNPQCGHPHT